MIKLDKEYFLDGIYYLSLPEKQTFDEGEYLRLRQKEGRIYTDAEVAMLPKVGYFNKLKHEWKVREKTLKKLLKYFSDKKENNILEVGCGNGWLSNALSEKTQNYFFALDLNQHELKQGARIFNENKRLKFVYGNVYENIFSREVFDFIIFPSSIQYFDNIKRLIERIFYFLKPEGEVHIIDSNLYSDHQVNMAELRSENYFNSLGFPKMINSYHHHKLTDLDKFNYKTKNKFSLSFSRINSQIIFPWIVIKRN